ncbi:TPA: hypothetical protein N0F65_007527 [Lagenidium giganteum]|uniref:Uncharacterized protein n=1 Tax=Lagenidium giganteum TaxID=4803 RepID=A0AAV2ZIN9_9STRA|nr:TPA: hypothetical protein N0F65_007527 [Lagenidium giganteum]
MEAQRHVSRWRLCRSRDSDLAAAGVSRSDSTPATASQQQSATVDDASDGQAPVSLRYLNEFVSKLQCAPALLDHKIFPDAKEITESMGLFNAVHRFLLPDEPAIAADESDANAKSDGIVVVGDGNTPRSAAMFAFRLKNWKCYSVDPAMEKQSTPRSHGWESIENLVVVRNKIENVRITLRRAIVVLVHAHVTLPQALSAIDAETVLGVVTMPCCNWYGEHEQLNGRHPDLVYDDFSVMSNHREIRLWAHESRRSAISMDLFAATANKKGWIRKEFVGGEPAVGDGQVLDESTQQSSAKPAASPFERFHNMFISADKEHVHEGRLVTGPSGKMGKAIDSAISQRGYKNILLLDAVGTEETLLRYLSMETTQAVYTIKPSNMDSEKITNSCRFQLTRHQSNEGSQLSSDAAGELTIESAGIDQGYTIHCDIHFDCVVDRWFLYNSFRDKPKNVVLIRSLMMIIAALGPVASVSPRKDWRKKVFWSHPHLCQSVESCTIRGTSEAGEVSQFIYFCTRKEGAKRAASTTPVPYARQAEKETILALSNLLTADFFTRQSQLASASNIHSWTLEDVKKHELANDADGELVRFTGFVSRVRRFTTGLCFLSLLPQYAPQYSQGQINPGKVEVFLKISILNWTKEFFEDVIHMLHKGDEVDIVGAMDKNDRGVPILCVRSIRVLNSTFEAFD